MKITNRKRNILLISVITCLVLCLGITSVSIYTEAKAIEADLSKYGITAEEINNAYKNGVSLNDKVGLLMYFCHNEKHFASSYAEEIAILEYAKWKQQGVDDGEIIKIYDDINYSEEYLNSLISENTRLNMDSYYVAMQAYITLSKEFGIEYFRTSVIVSDDKLEMAYFEKCIELLLKCENGEISSDRVAFLSSYLFYRSRFLTDSDAIKRYKEQMSPVVQRNRLLGLIQIDPDHYTLDFNPLSNYANVSYARDEKGNVYDKTYYDLVKQFGLKSDAKID